jgi:transposase
LLGEVRSDLKDVIDAASFVAAFPYGLPRTSEDRAEAPLLVPLAEEPPLQLMDLAAVVTCTVTLGAQVGMPSLAVSCVPPEGRACAWPGPPRPSSCPDRRRTRWTLRGLRTRIERLFGIDVCRETVRKVLHQLGMSWKKAKKLLGRATHEARVAFVEDLRALCVQRQRDASLLLAYIDEAHVHQDADLGYSWSQRGERLWVASSSPGLHAKVSFYGVYLASEGQVRIWPYPRANGDYTIEVLRRLRQEFPGRPIVLLWDGASYHRAATVLEAAEAVQIRIVRLPAYSPDFMPVEALWKWMREEVTYNRCHDSSAQLSAAVKAFAEKINRDPNALRVRLTVKEQLDPEEEVMRFDPRGNTPCFRGTPGISCTDTKPEKRRRRGPRVAPAGLQDGQEPAGMWELLPVAA